MQFKDYIHLNRQILTFSAKIDADIIIQCSLTSFAELATGLVYTQTPDGQRSWCAAYEVSKTHGGFLGEHEIFKIETFYWFQHRVYYGLFETFDTKISENCYVELSEYNTILEHSKGNNYSKNLKDLEQLSHFLGRLQFLPSIS
jgi:hypothetical protein